MFFDGNSKGIAWIIQTKGNQFKQKREHPGIYFDKVTTTQSKYIALHTGLFWRVGKFIIHNQDKVTIKIDNQLMFDQLAKNKNSSDEFIEHRSHFIFHLINQRQLKINYEIINLEENPVSKLI